MLAKTLRERWGKGLSGEQKREIREAWERAERRRTLPEKNGSLGRTKDTNPSESASGGA